MRWFVARFLLPALLLSCAPAPKGQPSAAWISVESRPLALNPDDPARQGVGGLRFLGGVQLLSADGRMGGLSSLRWAGGRLYAVSDAGDWLAMEVREEGPRLVGVGRVRIARLAGLDGQPLKGKAQADAEALDLDFADCDGGDCVPTSAQVAFEQDHRVWTYDLKDGMPVGVPRPLDVPRAWLAALPGNGGVEALAGRGGERLLIAEERRDRAGRSAALVLGEGGWRESGVAAPEGFSPTDADWLGPGRHARGNDYLVLFRRYSLMAGVAARVGRVTVLRDADGQARISGMVPVAELKPPMSVDNMEGLAIRREGGRVYVYMVSDDNFSGAQRTLLLKFELNAALY